MQIDNFPLSNRLIREVHGLLLKSGRGNRKSPGEFRRSQNWIGGSRPDNAHFIPPPAHRVEDCMSDLEKFIHSENHMYSALVKTGLTHAQFETIHPFLDGNGRVGRLLIALQLYHEGLLRQPMFYISLFIDKHREQYYQLLNSIRTDGKWEEWLEFFLTAIQESSADAVATAKNLSTQFRIDEDKIRSSRKGSAVQIHHAFQRRPLLTINEICRFTGLTFPSVSNGLKMMEKLGIIHELTRRKRNRIFVYSKYLAILDSDERI